MNMNRRFAGDRMFRRSVKKYRTRGNSARRMHRKASRTQNTESSICIRHFRIRTRSSLVAMMDTTISTALRTISMVCSFL